jgi:hypothetical protein
MKINKHVVLNEKFEPEQHFYINISLKDLEKYGDNLYDETSKEFVKYAKDLQKNPWKIFTEESVSCEQCLSNSVPTVIESEKYTKE